MYLLKESDFTLIRKCSTFADLIQFFDLNIWDFTFLCRNKTKNIDKVVYRCNYSSCSTNQTCNVCLYIIQTNQFVEIYETKVDHNHDKTKEYIHSLKTDKKVAWLFANDYMLVREFYSSKHVQEFIDRTKRWKVIFDSHTRFGERKCFQCIIQRSDNQYCDSKLRLSNSCEVHTTKLLISKAKHNHDVARESQCSDLPIKLPDNELDDSDVTKLILDSQLENINWIYLGIFSSLQILQKLLIAEQFVRPHCIENFLECVIQCNFRNSENEQCSAEIILAHQPNCDNVHILKTIINHNHTIPLSVFQCSVNFNTDFITKIENYIKLLSLPGEKYMIGRECDGNNYKEVTVEIDNLYNLGFTPKLICDFIEKCKKPILPPERDFIFILNDIRGRRNQENRQEYWNRILCEAKIQRTPPEIKSSFQLTNKFNSIFEAENYLKSKNEWEFFASFNSLRGFRHFFQCQCINDCVAQIYLSFDGLNKKILYFESFTQHKSGKDSLKRNHSESKNRNVMDCSKKLINDSEISSNNFTLSLSKRSEIFDKGCNWKLIKILKSQRELDNCMASKTQWKFELKDASQYGIKYYYSCFVNYKIPSCPARLMVFQTNTSHMLLYLSDIKHNHSVAHNLNAYEDTRFEILDLFKMGFDNNSICKYLENKCFDLPDCNIFIFVSNITTTSVLFTAKRSAYYMRINNNENICTCPKKIDLDNKIDNDWHFDRKMTTVIHLEQYLMRNEYWLFDHVIDTSYGFQHHFSCKFALNYQVKCKSTLQIIFNGETKEISVYRSKIKHNHDSNVSILEAVKETSNFDKIVLENDKTKLEKRILVNRLKNVYHENCVKTASNKTNVNQNSCNETKYIPILTPIKVKRKINRNVCSTLVPKQNPSPVDPLSNDSEIGLNLSKILEIPSKKVSKSKIIKVAGKMDYIPILRRVRVKMNKRANKTSHIIKPELKVNENQCSRLSQPQTDDDQFGKVIKCAAILNPVNLKNENNKKTSTDNNHYFQKSFLKHVQQTSQYKSKNSEVVAENLKPCTSVNSNSNNLLKDDWIIDQIFENHHKMAEYLKTKKIWELTIQQNLNNQKIKYYRCNLVPHEGLQCAARIKCIHNIDDEISLLRTNKEHTHDIINSNHRNHELESYIINLYNLGFDVNFISEIIINSIGSELSLEYCNKVIKCSALSHNKIIKFSKSDYAVPKNINDYVDLFADAKWIFTQKFKTAEDAQDFLDADASWEFCLKKVSATRFEYFYRCYECNVLMLFISNAISCDIFMYRTILIHDHNPVREIINDLYVLGFDAEFIYIYLESMKHHITSISQFNDYYKSIRNMYSQTTYIENYSKRWRSVKQLSAVPDIVDYEWLLEGSFHSVRDVEDFLENDDNYSFVNCYEYQTGFQHYFGCSANTKHKEIECEVMIYFDFDADKKEIRFYRLDVDHNHLNENDTLHDGNDDLQMVYSDDSVVYEDEDD